MCEDDYYDMYYIDNLDWEEVHSIDYYEPTVPLIDDDDDIDYGQYYEWDE